MGEESFGKNDEPVDLLHQFADGGGQWRGTLCHVFLDGVGCFVGGELKVCVFLPLLFLDGECAEADGEDAYAMVAGLKGGAWHEFVVDDVVGQSRVAEFPEGRYLCAKVIEEGL